MPIYAYKCASCGFAKDVLQKISDEPLTVCPACNAAAFTKQLTAAGFQLKGSGWYATDFRNGQTPPPAAAADGAKPADDGKADAKAPDAAAAPKPDAPAPAPAATSAPASGGSST